MGLLDKLRNLVTPSPTRYVLAATNGAEENEDVRVLFMVTYYNGTVKNHEMTVKRGSIHDVVSELMAYGDVWTVSAYEFLTHVAKSEADVSAATIVAVPAIVEFAATT